MKGITKFFAGLDWILEKLNIFLMSVLALTVIVSVFLRYVLNISFIWAEEMIVFIFIATTYYGIILCVKEDEHISIDFFMSLFSPVIQKIVKTFISLISVVTLIWLAKVSLGWIDVVGNTLSPGMKIAYKFVYIWMPISFVLSAIYEIRKCVNNWRGITVKKDSDGFEIEKNNDFNGKEYDEVEEVKAWK